jgi:hypothetical protein
MRVGRLCFGIASRSRAKSFVHDRVLGARSLRPHHASIGAKAKRQATKAACAAILERRFWLFPLDFELLFLFGVHFLDYGALIGRSGSLRPTRRRRIAGQGSLTRPVLCGPGSRSFRRRRVVSRCRLDLDGRAEHRENCSCSEIPHCVPPWRLGSRLFVTVNVRKGGLCLSSREISTSRPHRCGGECGVSIDSQIWL